MNNLRPKIKIGIVGGGAAGLMAAIVAASKGASVVILEAQNRVGRKILSTGNGRCNYTNLSCEANNFHGPKKLFMQQVLELFNQNSSINFFKELGIFPYIEEGRVYPVTQQATTILDALRREIARLGINVICDSKVTQLSITQGGFLAKTSNNTYSFEKIILATGSSAAPFLGATSDGLELAQKLNLSILPSIPALVPIKLKSMHGPHIHGVRCNAHVKLLAQGTCIWQDRGEIMFTSYGLSGIPALQMSYCVSVSLQKSIPLEIEFDLLSDVSHTELLNYFLEWQKKYPEMVVTDFCSCLVNKKLVVQLLDSHKVNFLNKQLSALSHDEITFLISAFKSFKDTITGTLSGKEAQVMGGGVDTAGLNPKTMESLLCKGLYCAGEVCAVVGDCGGYNLQWAWSSGYCAGLSASS